MCWEGVREEEVEVEGQRRGMEYNKERKKTKKIIEDLSQAEAGSLRHSRLIQESRGAKIYAKAQITHQQRSCRSKNSLVLTLIFRATRSARPECFNMLLNPCGCC